jgi:hypothetical protein
MALTDQELKTWRFLTDDLVEPPEEYEPPGGKVWPLRIFLVPPGDDRFPSHLSMPRLMKTAPERIKVEWLRTLVAEFTGTCPTCHAVRGEEHPTIRHKNCALTGFGRRTRGWLIPGSIDALAAALSPPAPRPPDQPSAA